MQIEERAGVVDRVTERCAPTKCQVPRGWLSLAASFLLAVAFVMPIALHAGDKNVAEISAPPTNSPPVITPLTDLMGAAGSSLEFGASATDADGDELTYTWSFGDGSPLAVGNPVTHTYLLAGCYTFAVYVDDSHGNNMTSSATAWASFSLGLFAGWNLVSLPLVGWGYMASTLGLDSGDVVTCWDPLTQTYKNVYTAGHSPPFRDFPILPNAGYWVYSGSSKTLDIYGYVPEERQIVNITVPLGGGWAFFGFVGLNSHKASQIPGMFSGGSVCAVAHYELPYHILTVWIVGGPPFKDFYIMPGEACMIWCTSSGVLAYDP